MSKYRATIKQWGEITGIVVLDPDGFDRKDPRLMERLFTYDEFQHGLMSSTIQRPLYKEWGTFEKPTGVLPFEASQTEGGE